MVHLFNLVSVNYFWRNCNIHRSCIFINWLGDTIALSCFRNKMSKKYVCMVLTDKIRSFLHPFYTRICPHQTDEVSIWINWSIGNKEFWLFNAFKRELNNFFSYGPWIKGNHYRIQIEKNVLEKTHMTEIHRIKSSNS